MSDVKTARRRLDIRNAIANTLLVLLVCAGCGASSVQESDPVIARFKDHLATSDSVYISMTANLSNHPTGLGWDGDLIIRGIAPNILAIDKGNGHIRYSFDGLQARMGDNSTITEANATTNALILAAWLEIRAGLPNTTFVPESPTVHDPKTPIGILKWYRVDFPFSEFGTRLFYIGFNKKTLEPERVTVFRGPGGAPVKLKGRIESPFRIDAIDWNAPIDIHNINTPEARVVGRSWARAQGRLTHRQGTNNGQLVAPVAAKRLQLDYVGRRIEQPQWVQGTWDGLQPSLSYLPWDSYPNREHLHHEAITCSGQAGVWLAPFEYQWRSKPNDPLLQRLPQMLSCPECFLTLPVQAEQDKLDPGLHLALNVHAEVGAQLGGYTVLKAVDWAVQWDALVDSTRILGGGGAIGARKLAATELASYDGGDVLVKLTGTYSVTCDADVQGSANVSFYTWNPPVIDFRNCPNE